MWFIFFSDSVRRGFSSGGGADWRSSDDDLEVAIAEEVERYDRLAGSRKYFVVKAVRSKGRL